MDECLKSQILSSATGSKWKRIGLYNHFGIALSLGSLRTKSGSGIGEFYDLFLLIDFCVTVGFDVIQLLPLNDSGPDLSPYNAVSSCALHPIFLSLHKLPYIKERSSLKKKIEDFSSLNGSPNIQYSAVQSHKTSFFRDYYEENGSKILQSKAYEEFKEKNSWLDAYALFKVIKDLLNQASFSDWPDELKYPSSSEFDALIEKYNKEMNFYFCLQYLCFFQLKEVKKYAKEKGVLLKGDIPILISRDSADVWHHPELFYLNFAAGAPPDQYVAEGQYWGFPIFNWEAMKKDKYQWWKTRLEYASQFYDLFRIDHVIGFFRIWAIPLNHPSKEGQFIPKNGTQWKEQGREILETLIESSSMLPLAEDLGVVPDSIKEILQQLGICGTKVMRWERMWNEDKRFIPIEDYPSISLTCVSTHDSPTLALWWRDYPEEAKAYAHYKGWTYAPELSQIQREEILLDSNYSSSVFHINLLQEYLALIPSCIWERLEEERINIPGKVLPTNWTYRFRMFLEDIISNEPLIQTIQKLLPAKRDYL